MVIEGMLMMMTQSLLWLREVVALLLLSEVLIEVYIDDVAVVAVAGGYIDVCLETLCEGGLNYYQVALIAF